MSSFSNLDELIIECRAENSKKYIKEAITCYRSGALRASIVSTWVAVIFDLIDKLRELGLAGDNEAAKLIKQFDDARERNDLAASLKFERDILGAVRDKIQLISAIEYIDLNRIQEDRNRCAHPSMINDVDVFNPSGELARTHIRSAIDCLLKNPPAQGKAALTRLLSEVDSSYFPMEEDKARVVLNNSPLFNARDNLVNSFITVLIKNILDKDKVDLTYYSKIYVVLKIIRDMHGLTYDNTLTKNLSKLIRLQNDDNIHAAVNIILYVDDSFSYFDEDVKLKVKKYILDFPSEYLEVLNALGEIVELKHEVVGRINKITRRQLLANNLNIRLEEFNDLIIDVYSNSGYYADANDFAHIVVANIDSFNMRQIGKLIDSCALNNQIYGSRKIGSIINALNQIKFENEPDFINDKIMESHILDLID
ncbi:TPA: hypothetical protein ACPY8E_003477 [Yersinia enterocolitica]|nr:hypothetical protein [Yersinia enterocolitica]EKN5075352.1 hypothetical protein [Yersinia enterocolitica]EKN6374918.1 hypothetical protein [Yersinia enterocolitica]HEF7278669.1 hypothetical protein [Yersinia enterocolitica]HEG1697537.1 hypothetical protein [Yersinia enterocolitica]